MNIQIKRWFLPLLVGGFALAWLASLQAAEVVISDAFVREMPPGAVSSAAYLTLKNTTDRGVVLKAVQADRAAQVMIHQTAQHGDMLRMRHVSQVEIAAHSEVVFSPGGYHLMIMGLSKPLQRGEEITLTFQFTDGRSIKMVVPVVAGAGSMMPMDMVP
jgi:periplasmic copper chaperone A